MQEVFTAANNAALNHVNNKEQIKAAMKDCQDLFWSAIAPIHYITYQEFLKIYDYYEEHNLIKFTVKGLLNTVKEEFEKYQEYMSANYSSEAYAVPYDLSNNIYKGVEKEILDMNLTFKFYMERNGMKDVEIKSQIQTVSALFDCWRAIWDTFFDRYRKAAHINFEGYYSFANLNVADKTFMRFYRVTINPERYKKYEPCKNYPSVMAFNALADKLTDDKFVDEKSIVALTMNNRVEELAEIFDNDKGLMQNAKITRKNR